MWRKKGPDVALIESFLDDLKTFKQLKREKWEQIEESVQMSNLMGTPTEDWIVPPDDEKVRDVLELDSDYLRLKKNIEEKNPQIKEIARFIGMDTHHKFDWIKFTDPLIGMSALEDATNRTEELLHQTKNTSYFFKNFMCR